LCACVLVLRASSAASAHGSSRADAAPGTPPSELRAAAKESPPASAESMTRAIDAAVLGPEHAAEHAAIRRAERKWARLGPQPPAPAPIFCSGLSQLANGDVVVAGGNLIYGDTFADDGYTTFAGLNTIFTFDPFTETWVQQPDMAHGRWYPTQTLLPDGRTIIT